MVESSRSETADDDTDQDLAERVEQLEDQLAQEEKSEREALESQESDENEIETVEAVEVSESGGDGVVPVAPDRVELAQSTYSASFGEYKFQLIPLNTRQGVIWEGRVLREGTAGPLLTKRWPDRLTDAEADALGVPLSVQCDFNDALEFLAEEVELSDAVEGPRESRSFRDLDALRERWEVATTGGH